MAFLDINPRYRPLLERLRLTRFEQFLSWPAVIVSGHPERNVARLTLGTGPEAVGAFLKREHRVRWRDRLANAWAGFGPVSRSRREALVLRALSEAGVNGPEWIAVGEQRGQAFLLVREVAGAADLRQLLRDEIIAPAQRRELAARLGEALARVHAAGFDHPDLYSKHVLVEPGTLTVWFLDWQRSRRHCWLDWQQRCRDLAALDATLPAELASPGDRLTCLRAYLGDVIGFRAAARQVRARAQRLLRKQHVREARDCLLPLGRQAVIWLDGEALCVTPEFWRELGGRLPDWLRLRSDEAVPPLVRTVVPLGGGRRGLLVRRRETGLLRWLWLGLRRRPLLSPELREAGALFRRQRQGAGGPRLLAFGQKRTLPWRTESFLLTEIEPAACRRSAGAATPAANGRRT
jgi:tRNA A-37 threonylcarbamoyl transferase component Bud32